MIEDYKFCQECGSELKGDESFCSGCGLSLTKENDENICPFCKSEVKKNATKCSNCGEWVDDTKKPLNLLVNKILSHKKFPILKNLTLSYILIYPLFYKFFSYIHVWIIDNYFQVVNNPIDTTMGLGLYYADYYEMYPLSKPPIVEFFYSIGDFLFGEPYVHISYGIVYYPTGNFITYFNNLWVILFVIAILISLVLVFKNKKSNETKIFLILSFVSLIICLSFNVIEFKTFFGFLGI